MIVLSLLKERNFKQLVLAGCAYATGGQKEEDGKTFLRDKRNRDITCVFIGIFT